MSRNAWEKHRDECKRHALSELENMLATVERTARHMRLWLQAESFLVDQSAMEVAGGVIQDVSEFDELCARCEKEIDQGGDVFHNVVNPERKGLPFCSTTCAVLPMTTDDD